MIVSFDQNKREANQAKHGLDLADGGIMLRGVVKEWPDLRADYGEDRWTAIGLLGTQVVVCIWAEYDDEFRIISLRRAESHERAEFEAFLAGRG